MIAGARAAHVEQRRQVAVLAGVDIGQDDDRAFQALEAVDGGPVDFAGAVLLLIGQAEVAQRA